MADWSARHRLRYAKQSSWASLNDSSCAAGEGGGLVSVWALPLAQCLSRDPTYRSVGAATDMDDSCEREGRMSAGHPVALKE